jgi:hypothetical protein
MFLVHDGHAMQTRDIYKNGTTAFRKAATRLPKRRALSVATTPKSCTGHGGITI